MPYICAYMYFQHVNQDYKEMGAALLASGVCLVAPCATLMGLWQLHVFKQWAISSIKSMESLGYETRLAEKMNVEADESGSDEDGGSDSDGEAKLMLKKSTQATVRMKKPTEATWMMTSTIQAAVRKAGGRRRR